MVVLGGGAVSYEQGSPVEAKSTCVTASGEVSRGEKMLESGTDPESYITEYTLVYEEKRVDLLFREHFGRAERMQNLNPKLLFFFFTLVTGPRRSLGLKLNDTRVYAPQI